MDRVLAFVAALLFIVLVVWVTAANEAKSFRKLTGRTDVTTWDAVWVELRVDCRN